MRVCLADKKIRIKYTYAPITTDRGIRIFLGGKIEEITDVLFFREPVILR